MKAKRCVSILFILVIITALIRFALRSEQPIFDPITILSSKNITEVSVNYVPAYGKENVKLNQAQTHQFIEWVNNLKFQENAPVPLNGGLIRFYIKFDDDLKSEIEFSCRTMLVNKNLYFLSEEDDSYIIEFTDNVLKNNI